MFNICDLHSLLQILWRQVNHIKQAANASFNLNQNSKYLFWHFIIKWFFKYNLQQWQNPTLGVETHVPKICLKLKFVSFTDLPPVSRKDWRTYNIYHRTVNKNVIQYFYPCVLKCITLFDFAHIPNLAIKSHCYICNVWHSSHKDIDKISRVVCYIFHSLFVISFKWKNCCCQSNNSLLLELILYFAFTNLPEKEQKHLNWGQIGHWGELWKWSHIKGMARVTSIHGWDLNYRV